MEALSALGRFRGTDTESVEFPATLNNRERAFVHKHCKLLGLNSKSHGAGESRRLVVTRKSVLGPKSSRVPTFTLRDESLARLREHLRSNPISKSDLSTPTSAVSAGNRHRIRASVLNPSMGGDGTLAAPPADARAAWRSDQKALKSRRGMDAILGGRHALPSWSARDDVTRALRESNVVVVSGETGTGKSTQVPQFILDDELSGPTANIIVTQPRRLSATSLAERVAFERGERVGETVGYNVRLDNATSSRTRLLFCTTGVILRRVTSDPALAGVTHLIIDEAHERDVNSDFLLAILRDVLPLRPDLRVLVMSATIHLQLFVDFFARRGVAGPTPAPSLPAPDAAAASASAAADHDADAPPSTARPRCVFIRGTTHRVTRFFLNDVLVQTGYMEAAVRRAKARKGGGAKAASGAGPTAAAGDGSALAEAAMAEDEAGEEAVDPASFFDCPSCQAYGFKSVDEYASHVATCFGPENPGEGGTRGGRRPDTGAAAGSAPVSGVEELDAEEDGAPPAMFIDPVAAAAAATAAEAESASGSGAAAAASSAAPAAGASGFALPTGVKGRDADAAEEGVSPLVATYQKGKGDQLERVDASLVAALVKHIYVNSGPGSALWRERRDSGAADASSLGAILVFLPGWEDITAVRDALRSDALLGDDSRAQILALHSAVPGREQRRVFQRPPAGVLKVVLSTNIAETSLTIDDVVYVIDSGLHKQKGHDAYTGLSSLSTRWISKASARQRAGRAGRVRPGICYHLFSQRRHEGMQGFETPEILRTPLDELCLQVKLLQRQWSVAPRSGDVPASLAHLGEASSAAAFLDRALEPPPKLAVDAALQLLSDIGATDVDAASSAERLTPLGEALAQLPLPPRLGKMILHSVLLRCVDPVVTIAAAVSYRSPFVLPMNPADKASADQAKRDLAGGLPSDHMALLGAYQGYSQAAASRREFQFCRSRFLSHSVLRMVHGIRIQLLRELQHSGVVTRAQLESRGPDGANYNSNNGAVVSAALAAGLYPQLAMRAPFQAKLETRGGRLLDLHGSSVNAGVLRAVAAREVDARKRDEDEAEGGGGRGGGRFGSRSDSRALSGPAAAIAAAGSRGGVQWFAFEEVMQTGMGKHSVRDTTMVPAAALALLCGAAGGARDGTPDPAARCLGSSQLIECIAASLGVVALGAGGDDSPAPDTLVVPRSLRDWPPTYADQLRRTATGAALSHAWVAEPPIRDAGSLAAAAAECKNDEDREASAASLRHSTNESVRSAVLGPCSGMTAALGDGMVLLRVDGWIGLGVPAAVAPAMAALRLRLRRAMDDLVLSPFVARLGGTPRTLSPKDLRAHTDAVSTACDLLTLEVFGRLPASSGGPLHSSSSPLTPMQHAHWDAGSGC